MANTMALIGSEAATPVADALDERQWRELADEEYRRLLEVLGQLTPEEWHAATDCDGWDVYDLVCHLAGSAEASADESEATRQLRLGKQMRPDADPIDAMNAVQVDERRVESPRQLLIQLAEAGQRSLAAPRAASWTVRTLRGLRPAAHSDVPRLRGRRLVRHLWMHRVDVCRATWRPLYLTPDHDGRIVDDLVAEWAATHGEPFTLRLTGPAGDTWSAGHDGAELELDAVEFARLVSGRGQASGLLATRVTTF